MLYRFLRLISRLAIRAYYGKLLVQGIERIPAKGPLLIACNHPNGFLEPIIIGCLMNRPLHFLVRGDVFEKPWLRPILVHSNQIPIFRFKDGFSGLRKNTKNIELVMDALDRGAAIIIFIEGSTEPVKTLRPFQKGLARMAAQYLERKSGRSLKILPVGINFVSPTTWRSNVYLNFGHPLDAATILRDDQNQKKEIRILTNLLYQKMEKMVFDVPQENRQNTLDKALGLAEGWFPKSFYPFRQKSQRWHFFKKIANGIAQMNDEEFVRFENELEPYDHYQDLRKCPGLYSWLVVLILLVPGGIGLLVNIIPAMAAKIFAYKKVGQSEPVFLSSLTVSVGVGFFILYYLLLLVLAIVFFGCMGWRVLLGIPLGYLSIYWWHHVRNSIFASRYCLSKNERAVLRDIFESHGLIGA